MPAVFDDALCIRQWDWSETSQTVSLFARSMGVVRGLAKGSRRPRSPYSGGIELLTRAEAGVIVRPGSELALITEWDLRETFAHVRRDLGAHRAALYIAELVHLAVRDHDPHTALFDATVRALRMLAEPADRPEALLRFQWSLLLETGYSPVLDEDVIRRGPLPAARVYLFDPGKGGFTPDTEDAAPGADGWRVRAGTLQALRGVHAEVDSERSEPAPQPATPAERASVERANRLLGAYLTHVLGREPQTLGVLFDPDAGAI